MMLTTSRGALFCAFFCLFLSLGVVTLSALRFEEDDLGSKLSSVVLVPRSVRLVLAVGAMKCISAREVGRGGAELAREPEVANLDDAREREEDVLGREVAV